MHAKRQLPLAYTKGGRGDRLPTRINLLEAGGVVEAFDSGFSMEREKGQAIGLGEKHMTHVGREVR